MSSDDNTRTRIVFIVPSVTGNQVTRAYPFAKLLHNGGLTVTITGKGQEGKESYLKNSPGLRVLEWPCRGFFESLRIMGELVRAHDIVCVSKPCSLGTTAALFAKIYGKRLVYDIDDDDFGNWIFDIRTDRRRIGIFRTLLRVFSGLTIILNFAARNLADDLMVASSALSEKFGGKIVYVPPDPFINKYDGSHNSARKKVIMYTGAIRGFKGLEGLIEAFRKIKVRVPEAELVFVGEINEDSIQTRKILEKARKTSQDIFFEGLKPIEETPIWMSRADCLVVTTPDNPIHRVQTPVKLLYYMAAGRPIVATEVGDIPEILDHGRAGLLVDPGDHEALADAISKILLSTDLSREIAENARNRFLNRYSSTAVGPKVLEIFGVES